MPSVPMATLSAFTCVVLMVVCTGYEGDAHYIRGIPEDRSCGPDFDPQTKMCCAGIARPKRAGFECCGTRSFDANSPTRICCSGKLTRILGDKDALRCCGVRPFNRHRYTCCAGHIKHGHSCESA